MGVTYRYMGISYSLKDDKDTLFFCVPYLLPQTVFIENRTLQTGQDLLSRKSRILILSILEPRGRWYITVNKFNEKVFDVFHGGFVRGNDFHKLPKE